MQSTDISELSEVVLWMEVEEVEKQLNNIGNNLDEDLNIIYKPKSNPFSIFSFNIKLGIVTLEPYSEDAINLYELNKFNSSSAYCNSQYDLYISGGNSDDNISNIFWIIDKNKKIITKTEMPSPKENHSMIYLKEKFILVTGGNDLKTFFYDINQNLFISCADLNHKCSKPALFRYNNYIYCLCDLDEKSQCFERLCLEGDLSLSQWEVIYPSFGNASDSAFNVKNFGVTSEAYNGAIILGGGNITKNNTYVYDIENNILSLTSGKNENVFLEEKTFYRYESDTDYFVNFSGDFEKKQEIVFVNQKNKSVILVDVDSMDGKINKEKINQNNQRIKIEEANKMYGNVSIRIIYKKKENEKLKYDILGEKITPIFDDIMDDIDIDESNANEIDDNNKVEVKKDNKEELDLNENNIVNKSKTAHVIPVNDIIINEDENKINTINTFAVKGNNDNNKDKEEDTKHKIKGKVTKAIKGIKGIFKHKNKDKIEGEEEEKGKKEESENDGESKISKTKKYLKQLKRKFIKKRDSSVGNDKKNLNKKKEDKKERHNSFKAKNIPEE